MKKLYTAIAIATILAGGVVVQQPYVGCWHPEDIINWSPQTDQDAKFNQAKVPIAERFKQNGNMAANYSISLSDVPQGDTGRIVIRM